MDERYAMLTEPPPVLAQQKSFDRLAAQLRALGIEPEGDGDQ